MSISIYLASILFLSLNSLSQILRNHYYVSLGIKWVNHLSRACLWFLNDYERVGRQLGRKSLHTKIYTANLKNTVLWGGNSTEYVRFPGLPIWHGFNYKSKKFKEGKNTLPAKYLYIVNKIKWTAFREYWPPRRKPCWLL